MFQNSYFGTIFSIGIRQSTEEVSSAQRPKRYDNNSKDQDIGSNGNNDESLYQKFRVKY